MGKFSDADAIYPLIRTKKMSKKEWLVDFIVQPGIIQGADDLNDMSSYYLIERNGKQYFVNVSEDFIVTNELAEMVDPKKFVIGNHQYKKAVYQLV